MGFWVILLGLLVAVTLVVVAYTFQSKAALGGAAAAILIALAIVVVDYVTVTDKEQVRDSIYRLAVAVSNNDVAGALAEVSPTATQCIADVRSEMPNYDFQFCTVRRIENFEIDQQSPQPTTTVELRVLADVRVPSLSFGGKAPRVIQLNYRKEGDRWLIYDYDHWAPPELERFTGPGVSRDDLFRND